MADDRLDPVPVPRALLDAMLEARHAWCRANNASHRMWTSESMELGRRLDLMVAGSGVCPWAGAGCENHCTLAEGLCTVPGAIESWESPIGWLEGTGPTIEHRTWRCACTDHRQCTPWEPCHDDHGCGWIT